MKKLLIIASSAAIALTPLCAGANDDITVTVNGKNVEFDQPPVIENDRTLVPLRAIFEALGAEVDWNDETKTVTAKKNSSTISLTIDSAEMKIGDSSITLDVPAKIINDRTMVPVRAVSEAFECDVDWDGEARQVIITYSDTTPSASPDITASPSAAPDAATAPSVTTDPNATAAPSESTYAAAVTTAIEDDVNIFDTEWIVPKTEISATDGTEKTNEKMCSTDYIPVNAGKSYYAGYYDPNTFKYQTGHCVNYAFYDAEKKYISGAAADMSNIVTAPEYASYVRYSIKLDSTAERAHLYLVFMQTNTAPEEFTKSDATLKLAKTDIFKDKKIFIAGDNQLKNGTVWRNIIDRDLGANAIGIKEIGNLRYIVNDNASLCIEKTIGTFPTDADYIIIDAGFYDWMINSSLGTETGSSGGIYDFLSLAKTKWKNTTLVLMTLPNAKYAADGFTGAGLYNTLGKSTADYSEEIVEACEINDVPVVDISQLWSQNDIPVYMQESGLNYLYPNDEGQELIAAALEEKLIELESK